MIKPKVYECVVAGRKIYFEPTPSGDTMTITPGGPGMRMAHEVNDMDRFLFKNSKPKTIKAIGQCLIDAAEMVQESLREKVAIKDPNPESYRIDATEPAPEPRPAPRKKKVFVCSPYAGDVEQNVRKAISYCQIEIGQGNVPFAPHLFFPQILDESKPEQRKIGMQLGIEMMESCDEFHVYVRPYKELIITPGMQREIDAWQIKGRQVEHILIRDVV